MYKQIKTTTEIILSSTNGKAHPVATLSDGSGMCQILIDDHCYVLYLRQSDGKYKNTPYIFPEAFEVLRTLPSLRLA